MSNEDLKEIIGCLIDGNVVRSTDYKISKKSTDRLMVIFENVGTFFDLDSCLVKVITTNPQFFSFYGIKVGNHCVLYNGKVVFYTF